MCKHLHATIVNWYPVLGVNHPEWQCDLCGAMARHRELDIDFDTDGYSLADVNLFPLVDTQAYRMWSIRTSKPRVLTDERRREVIEQIGSSE